jgi:hypothetical protein
MRYYFLLILAIPALAQPRATFGYDAEGRRTPMPAPSQKVEERVISQGPDGKVVERIIRKFDERGQPTGAEKELMEEKRTSDGGKSVRTTVWDNDLNGGFTLRERATTQKRGEQSDTVVERPNPSGALEVAEKRTAVRTGDEKRYQLDTTVYRKGTNRGFEEAEREITQFQTEAGETRTTTTQYNAASTGKMEFAAQRVSRLTTEDAGSELEVVDLYGPSPSGRVTDGFTGAAPKLREQQVIERKIGADKSVVETLSVRRPEIDSDKLSPPQKVSQTVCQGSCRP